MRHKEHPIAHPDSSFAEPVRKELYALAQLEVLPVEVRHSYSAMKYGSVSAMKWWAAQMTAMIVGDASLESLYSQFGQVFIASSAYGSVPTAAALLAHEIGAGLVAAGWVVHAFQIRREGGFERTNYGTLGEAARRRALRARKIGLDAEVAATLNGKFVLVIDDLRCTGAHERAITSLLAEETTVAALAYGYCIAFQEAIHAGAEEQLNHALIRQPADLLPLFEVGGEGPLLNARMLKFILLQSPAELYAYCVRIGLGHCLRLYQAALSADGYFDKPRFREGFAALEEWLLQTGGIERRASYSVRNQVEGKVVGWNITKAGADTFICAETGADLGAEISRYSRFKFGDVAAIHLLAKTLSDKMIAALNSGGSLRRMFERAGAKGEFVCLTAPGVRNVVSASNFLMREVGLRVNVWLTRQGLPTMAIRTLARLSSGRANYAELNAKQRGGRDKTTQTVIPSSEYKEFPCHVIFLDDVEVSGQTSRRAKETSLKAGARSFHHIFAFRVDPALGQMDASVEHVMNHYAVKTGLDETLAGILQHPDYQPVQRMVRLLLHPRNRAELGEFLRTQVSDAVLLRLYLGAMANDYLWIHPPEPGEKGEYAPSLGILQEILQERRLVDAQGLPQ